MTHSLQELRDSLGQHADGVHDDHTHDRAALVHTRVRRVRRQRLAAGGALTAVAVVAAALAVALPSHDRPQPATHRLLGMDAPPTLTSLGYTYDYAQGFTGGHEATVVRLRASDQPRLLTWADRGDSSLKIVTSDHRTLVSHGDFRDFTVIPPGAGGTWTVHGYDTAAAVYDLTSARPDGHTKDGITFRDSVAGRELVSASIGDLGQADVRGSADWPRDGRVSLAWFCGGGTSHTWVHVELRGIVSSEGSSCDDSTFDPGTNVRNSFSGLRLSPDDSTSIRAWATDGRDGPIVDDPDLRLGFGIYWASTTSVTRLSGAAVDDQLEHDGHRWQLASLARGASHEPALTVSAPEDESVLVVAYFNHTGGRVQTFLDGQRGVSYGGQGGGGSGTLGVVSPGSSAGLRIIGSASPRAVLGLAFYSRLD